MLTRGFITIILMHTVFIDKTGVTCQFLGGAGSSPCPAGFQWHGSSCYRFVNVSYSWAESTTACSMMRASLVEINTSEENKFLTEYVQNETSSWRKDSLDERIWTGGSNMQGPLLWLYTQTPVGYTSWRAGEPYTTSDNEVYCIMKMADGWYSDKCTHNRNFVCEKEIDGQVIPAQTTTETVKIPVGR